MSIQSFEHQPSDRHSDKLNNQLRNFNQLLDAFRQHDIPESAADVINTAVNNLNHMSPDDPNLRSQVKLAKKRLIEYSVKHLNLIPREYYLKQWMAIGMSVFGIPIGIAFGTALGNMAFLGAGLAMGLPLGMAVGKQKDQKVADEGRQLDFKY